MQNLRHLCDPIHIEYLPPELIAIIREYYGYEFVPTRVVKSGTRILDVIDGDIYTLKQEGLFYYLVKNGVLTSMVLHPNVEHIHKLNEHQLLATAFNSGYLCDLKTSKVIKIKETVEVVDGEIYMFTHDRRVFRYGCESYIGTFPVGSWMERVGNSLMICGDDVVTLVGRPHPPQRARWLYEWNNVVYKITDRHVADMAIPHDIQHVMGFEHLLLVVTNVQPFIVDLIKSQLHRVRPTYFLQLRYNCLYSHGNGNIFVYE